MFSVEDLEESITDVWFLSGYESLERNLLRARLGLEVNHKDGPRYRQLSRFSQAVLASASKWDDPRSGKARDLCAKAGDVEAALGVLCSNHERRRDDATGHYLRAAVLYDIAGMPGTAASQVNRFKIGDAISSYFTRARSSDWGILSSPQPHTNGNGQFPEPGLLPSRDAPVAPDQTEELTAGLVLDALGEILTETGQQYQTGDTSSRTAQQALGSMQTILSSFASTFDSDFINALRRSLSLRAGSSTLRSFSGPTPLDLSALRSIGAPAELWPVQQEALKQGILDPSNLSFGLAAPTGTGKTALARLLLADFFLRNPGKKALYVTPSRALSSQVARDLRAAFEPIGIHVAALGGSLTLGGQSPTNQTEADLLVFTPEKADLLMRVDPETVTAAGLVVIDEAHHIEQGTRGILLEFYLWRLRSIIPAQARVVQLSAVTPNIKELVTWLSPAATASVKVDWRSNRLRLGIFDRTRNGGGIVQFGREAPYEIFGPGECSSDRAEGLADLALKLSSSGIVLVLTMSPGEAEKIASAIAERKQTVTPPTGFAVNRLDARIERELYPEAPLRSLVRAGVAYHHAELPPRVRLALEAVIEEKQIDIVCATTTLAEGVNFPFSTVVVQSLVGRNYELSPRSLWNIAGRAGRFGVDSEGHCILFRPSLWEARLKTYRLSDYTSTRLDDIPPVRSALATALEELKAEIDKGSVSLEALDAVKLDEIRADQKSTGTTRRIRGLINLMRVGYAHAGASQTTNLGDDSAPEFSDQILLASKQLSPDVREFATQLARRQRIVLRTVLAEDPILLRIAARIGWALETQSELYEWIRTREDWKLQQFGHLSVGGRIQHFERLGYLLGPVTKMMAELEGERLGGFTSFIAVKWLEGVPLTQIRESNRGQNFGRLVRLIYARVQYLLPWALFGMGELVQYEATKRNLKVGSGISDLSAFAAEGVSSFDALTLVLQLDLERVDATRLANVFHERRHSTDILGWLSGRSWGDIEDIVRGKDRRRLDPDLRPIWERLRSQVKLAT